MILLFMLSKRFLYSWRDLSLREEKMRNEVLVSRYEVLKNQINPHFMFNGLNALSSLVHEDQDLAVKYIEQLSKVLRYVLQAGKQEVVTLDEEIEILNSYIFLQKIRYNDNLIVDINLDNSGGSLYIAPLVLQMLIENAIKHNEITSDHPLIIKLSQDGEYLRMWNSVRIKEVALQESTHMGLANIQSRYQALTDQKVLIEDTEDEFSVSIPLINKIK
jgi:LytS/YehU family sensor histidine kinase